MILLADDFKAWRLYLRALLEKEPNLEVVDEAEDGFQAVEKARKHQPDVVLLDIGMPVLNGIEAAKKIREVSPHSKILMVSIERAGDFAEAALRAGAAGYIPKSEVSSKLLPAINRLRKKTSA